MGWWGERSYSHSAPGPTPAENYNLLSLRQNTKGMGDRDLQLKTRGSWVAGDYRRKLSQMENKMAANRLPASGARVAASSSG